MDAFHFSVPSASSMWAIVDDSSRQDNKALFCMGSGKRPRVELAHFNLNVNSNSCHHSFSVALNVGRVLVCKENSSCKVLCLELICGSSISAFCASCCILTCLTCCFFTNFDQSYRSSDCLFVVLV